MQAWIEMKNAEIFDFLKQLMIAAAILYVSPAPAGAQNTLQPPSITEPSPQPGKSADGAEVPTLPKPDTERSFSNEDYESPPDPFGRGCPFNDQDLDLVS